VNVSFSCGEYSSAALPQLQLQPFTLHTAKLAAMLHTSALPLDPSMHKLLRGVSVVSYDLKHLSPGDSCHSQSQAYLWRQHCFKFAKHNAATPERFRSISRFGLQWALCSKHHFCKCDAESRVCHVRK